LDEDTRDGTLRAPMPDAKQQAEELRRDVIERLPAGETWLKTKHPLLGGCSPNEAIESGDLESVRNLLVSILYVGIS